MEIKAAVIQGIKKEADSAIIELQTRDDTLAINEKLENLVMQVLNVYTKSQNTYGTFDPDSSTYQFSAHLRNYHSGAHDITYFSKLTMGLIEQQLLSSPKATGGYALFVRYLNQGHDFLLIVMLKLKESTGIDERLDLIDTLSLDIQHLHEAARINLSRWTSDEETYLSFVKKRKGKQDEVTKYFRLALGCTEQSDSRTNTKNALNALDSYCDAQGWDLGSMQRIELRKKTFEYFAEKKEKGEPVVLDSWSTFINDQEPELFKNFIIENNFEINDTFAPSYDVYKRLHRISSTIQKSIKLTFNVEDIMNDKIDYDAITNSVIIHNIPEELRDDILNYKHQDEDDTDE